MIDPPDKLDQLLTNLTADLTEDQRDAVERTEGPVLVLAAAGSGKTRVITRRIAYLLGLGIPAWSILALTFTNKAAGEMRERVQHLLASRPDADRVSRGLTVTTFHSLCARLLRRYAPLMEGRPDWGINGDYAIYDSDDQMALMKRTIKDMGLETSNWPARSVLTSISDAKNKLMDARAYEHEAADFYSRTTAQIYTRYEKAMRQANAVDFDDLLMMTVRLLRENDEARAEVQERWRWLMIDEYQDTNHAQFVLSTLVVGREESSLADGELGAAQPNICVVGDPDQSIYGWRGADIGNILDFERQYPGAQVVALGQNFRSRAPILACADTLIQHNARRKHKPLFTTKEGGTQPEVVVCRDEQHEAELVVDWLRGLAENAEDVGGDDGEGGEPIDITWKDMAVMYRNNALSRVVEDALRLAGVPYVVAKGTAFYQREEVKDTLAYLRVVANPSDEVSLRRIINKPARKIGKTSLTQVETFAARQGLTLFEACQRVSETGVSAAAQKAIGHFVELVDGWTGGGSFMGALVPTGLHELVERVVRESGLEEHYKKLALKTKAEADEAKIDNLAEVVSSAAQFEESYAPDEDPAWDPFDAGDLVAAEEADVASGSAPVNDIMLPDPEDVEAPPLLSLLRGYLESVALVADADKVDPARGAVTLLTLHAAKGLEFGAVGMIGLEEGTLPGQRAMESDAELEEERRLAFVGITRAEERLLLTSAKYRTRRGVSERCIPSRFIEEIGKDLIRVSDQSDPMGGLDDWLEGDSGYGPGGLPDTDGFEEGPSYEADEYDQRPAHEKLRELKSKPKGKKSFGGARLQVGQRVRHPRFGDGTVESVRKGMNASAKVRFDQTGTKTLILQYAPLQVIGT